MLVMLHFFLKLSTWQIWANLQCGLLSLGYWVLVDILSLSLIALFRSIIIKKAESIIAIAKKVKGDGKKEVRFISLLVAFGWGTFTLLNVIVLSTDESIPQNVTAVRICKGLTPIIDASHQKKMIRNNLLRLVTVFFVVFFVWTSQSRIKRYRRGHNKSYFSRRRQNIATIDQTIYYAYLKCFCNFLKSCQFMTLDFVNGSSDTIAIISLYMDIAGAIVGET